MAQIIDWILNKTKNLNHHEPRQTHSSANKSKRLRIFLFLVTFQRFLALILGFSLLEITASISKPSVNFLFDYIGGARYWMVLEVLGSVAQIDGELIPARFKAFCPLHRPC